MKDRRQLKLCVNNFITRSVIVQSRIKLQFQLWEGFKRDVLDRLDAAIRICCIHWKDQKGEKAKGNQDYIRALIDVEDRHKQKAIEQEIYCSKMIHAIQIVRYLRYRTDRFDYQYWLKILELLENSINTESEILKSIEESNKDINDAIEKAMNARSSRKRMSTIEAQHQQKEADKEKYQGF